MAMKIYEQPDQGVSVKNLAWHLLNANSMIDHLGGTSFEERLQNIRKLEEAYLAQPVKRASATQPYGIEMGGDYETYPLIEGILDDVTGKYLSRPPERTIYSINRDAVNSKLDDKVKMLSEQIFREQNKILEERMGVKMDTDNPDMELPDDVEEFFSKSYKTTAEELSEEIIVQFLDVNRNLEKIRPMLIEYLYGDCCAAMITEKDGHPTLEHYRYDQCYFDIDQNKEVQDEIGIFAGWRWMSELEIYNKYALTTKKKKKVKDVFQAMDSGDNLMDDIDTSSSFKGTYQNCEKGVSYKGWQQIGENGHRLRVFKMTWKSRRDVKNLVYTDRKTGKEAYKLLPDDYKERNRDKIKITTIETVHYIEMLGPEIVLSWGEVDSEDVIRRIDNKLKAYLPVIALVGRTFLRQKEVRSLAKKILGLQKYASDILYQMMQYVNSLDGKIMIYDAAQTPKYFIDTYGQKEAINRVMHHMKKDKMAIINSADKKGGYNFNQWTSLDLTNRGYFKDLMEGLMLVENLAAKFSGLTKENQEGGEKYQTATSVNRSVLASNSRIEVYYNPFDNFMNAMLTRLLQVSKTIYKKGEVFTYTFGDVKNKFINMHKEFWDADLGLYISNAAKNYRDKQSIDRGAEASLSNAQDPKLIFDLISVLEEDNATKAKGIFQRSVKALEEMQKQQAEREDQAQQAQLQDKADERKNASDDKEKDRQSQERIALIQSGDKRAIAEAQRRSADMHKVIDAEAEQDKMEMEKQQAQDQSSQAEAPQKAV